MPSPEVLARWFTYQQPRDGDPAIHIAIRNAEAVCACVIADLKREAAKRAVMMCISTRMTVAEEAGVLVDE